jgi:phospholipid/cholesterol/gamma-HCH transport system substrate-binding protein
MQQNKKLELGVGVFLLISIFAILVLVLRVADVSAWRQPDTYTLYAHFDNIGGLKVRAPIKIGGVAVGQITEITLDAETFIPKVALQLEKRIGFLPETSSASILTSGLLGEQYVGLSPGFMDEDIGVLENGDILEDTKSALVLEDMIGQVMYSLGGEKE